MGKGSVTTALEGRSNYGSSMPDSPKFSTDYVSSSSRGYGQKVDQLYSDRISEYPSIERRQYAERHTAYLGTDLPSEAIGRYADPVSFGHEHQVLNGAIYFFLYAFWYYWRRKSMLSCHILHSLFPIFIYFHLHHISKLI